MICIKAREAGGGTNHSACTRYNIFTPPRFLFHAARRGPSITPDLRTGRNLGRSTSWRVVKEKTMVRIYIVGVSLAFAVMLLAGKVPELRAEEGASVQQSITE